MPGTDDPPAPPSSVELPFAALVEDAPFAVLAIDEDSTVRYANDGVAELLGHDPEHLVGGSLFRVIPERLRTAHTGAFERYLESGESHLDWDRIELPAVHRDGHEVPVSIAIRETPIDGETLYTGIFSDNSRPTRLRERIEASIDALHELYIVASNATLSFETRREKIIELGCQYLDLPYGFVTEIDSATQRIVTAVGDHELLSAGAQCPIEQSYCRKTIDDDGFLAVANAVEEGWDGDPAYERFGLGSYIGGKVIVDGDLFGTLCFASTEPRGREFTGSERTFVEMASRWLGYEIERHNRTRRLERQNERLDRFASQVSHDLRNPLSVAVGRLELAIESHGEDEDLIAVRDALADADSRIDEMLEFARLGDAVTDPEPVSLADAADAAWAAIETGGARMTVREDVDLRGDAERIERLLENLFRNSVEHGSTSNRPEADDSVEHGSTGDRTASDDAAEHGFAAVSVALGAVEGGFYVADDGPGIPESDREDVLESGFTTSDDGSGFGLAIVEEIAAAHGWDVRVTDSAAGGARFEFVGADGGSG